MEIKKERNDSKMKKKTTIIIGMLLIAIILLTGTYAFQAFNQGAFNPAWDEELDDEQLWYEIAHGGRIHDVFQVSGNPDSPAQGYGTFNHDIFAENFGTEEIMVRVQLREFLSIDGASAIGGVDITDPMTWPVYLSDSMNATARRAGTPTHEIGGAGIEWTLGQAADITKAFMPTFNRATLPATSINPTVPTPFNHNEAFVFTDTTGRAVDARATGFNVINVTDANNIYRTGTQTGVGNPSGLHNYWTLGATHTEQGIVSHPKTGELLNIGNRENTARATLTPDYGGVMTIAQWTASNRPVGNFWILDTDGWFYWKGTLAPEQATSLLLDRITLPARTEAWEYVIYVNADFFTVETIGELLPAPTPEMGIELDAMNPPETLYIDSTGTVWYILVQANDERGGVGNKLMITAYVHMTNTLYHNTLGFTSFINSNARTNVENWFNDNNFVSQALRSRVLDYEFQDAEGNSILRNSTAVGAGIEVNRANGSTNNTASVPVTTNITRAHTRPVADSRGNGMAFILSTSEINEYFENDVHRQALITGSSTTGSWWLRSPGYGTAVGSTYRHALISTSGNVHNGVASTYVNNRGHRPAIWVSSE